MNLGLIAMGINTYNLAPTLLEVYDYQQNKYNEADTFSLISLVGMALLELGVIIECEEEPHPIKDEVLFAFQSTTFFSS